MEFWLEQGRRAGIYGDLAFQFGRFLLELDGRREAEPLAVVAALLAERSLAGDVCLELNRLPEMGENFPLPSPETVEEQLVQSPVVTTIGGREGSPPLLVFDPPRLYLYRHYLDEIVVAEGISSRLTDRPLADAASVAPLLDRFKDPDQRLAAALALLRPFLVISGGPGTGKSWTAVQIVQLLRELRPDFRIALAAPTGKAAARLTQLLVQGGSRLEAQTIHRLLRLGRRDRFGPDDPVPIDLLIVDEASMVDLSLAAKLFSALRPETRILLLGDRHQLASVEAGSFLGDVTGRGAPPRYPPQLARWLRTAGVEVLPRQGPPIAASLVELRTNYRFSPRQGIGRLAAAIRQGEVEEAVAALEEGDGQVFWHPCCGEEALAKGLSWLEVRHRPLLEAGTPQEALARVEENQLLTVLREGPFGEEGIASRFERRLLGAGLVTDRLYPRLPILITQNDYELGLFNGDLGIVWALEGRLRAFFRHRGVIEEEAETLRALPVCHLPPWRKAWALTVHKAQGSEFDEVALLLPDRPHPLLSRELLYTAVTRARRRMTLIGDRQLLRSAIARRCERRSGLAERLGWS